MNIPSALQAQRYLTMLLTIMASKQTVNPRGMEIKEVEDLQLKVNPTYPFMTFKERNYNLDYFKKEMKWKLGANKYDESIKEAAKMWDKVQNPDGTFNSNYGQYWFGEQMGIWHVVMELMRDPDSRRAVIPMLNASHMTPQTRDTVCTESVGFRIRVDELGIHRLNMSVHMRSSDVIFGLGTDIPTFSFLYRLVYALIEPRYALIEPRVQWLMSSLQVGEITITAMSSHIYSIHYKMVERIIEGGINSYEAITMPYCFNSLEAMQIIANRGVYSMANRVYAADSLINWVAI